MYSARCWSLIDQLLFFGGWSPSCHIHTDKNKAIAIAAICTLFYLYMLVLSIWLASQLCFAPFRSVEHKFCYFLYTSVVSVATQAKLHDKAP